jgi:hypothetical protein
MVMGIGTLFAALDYRVQIMMLVSITVISVTALVTGETSIAFTAIVAFSPTPLGMIAAAWSEMRLGYKVKSEVCQNDLAPEVSQLRKDFNIMIEKQIELTEKLSA